MLLWPQVQADDIDHGDNATVRYRLHKPTKEVKAVVGIGDSTGEIRLGQGLRAGTRNVSLPVFVVLLPYLSFARHKAGFAFPLQLFSKFCFPLLMNQ